MNAHLNNLTRDFRPADAGVRRVHQNARPGDQAGRKPVVKLDLDNVGKVLQV